MTVSRSPVGDTWSNLSARCSFSADRCLRHLLLRRDRRRVAVRRRDLQIPHSPRDRNFQFFAKFLKKCRNLAKIAHFWVIFQKKFADLPMKTASKVKFDNSAQGVSGVCKHVFDTLWLCFRLIFSESLKVKNFFCQFLTKIGKNGQN